MNLISSQRLWRDTLSVLLILAEGVTQSMYIDPGRRMPLWLRRWKWHSWATSPSAAN